jgi:hypothetical protein
MPITSRQADAWKAASITVRASAGVETTTAAAPLFSSTWRWSRTVLLM